MIVRTETDAIKETHKDEVPTNLMRTEDIPGCTEYCSKELSAQDHATIFVPLSMGLCGVRGGMQILRKAGV